MNKEEEKLEVKIKSQYKTKVQIGVALFCKGKRLYA